MPEHESRPEIWSAQRFHQVLQHSLEQHQRGMIEHARLPKQFELPPRILELVDACRNATAAHPNRHEYIGTVDFEPVRGQLVIPAIQEGNEGTAEAKHTFDLLPDVRTILAQQSPDVAKQLDAYVEAVLKNPDHLRAMYGDAQIPYVARRFVQRSVITTHSHPRDVTFSPSDLIPLVSFDHRYAAVALPNGEARALVATRETGWVKASEADQHIARWLKPATEALVQKGIALSEIDSPETAGDIDAIYEKIIQQLAKQYKVGYYTAQAGKPFVRVA